jgi:hypothetical protein
MSGALALGSVAAVGAIAPAEAAGSSYTCTLTSGPTPLDIVGTMDLPSSVAPGGSLADLPTTLGVTLPGSLTTLLVGLGITNVAGSVTDAKFPIGSTGTSIPAGALTESGTALTAGSPATLTGKGKTASSAKAPSKAGSYNVMMPSSFTFVPTGGLPPIPCTTAAPVKLGTLLVSGDAVQASTTTAKLKNAPITTSKHAKIGAKVRTGGEPASGKVIAKEGSKVLKKATLNDSGKATLKLPLLSKGKHKIVVKYKGNSTTEPSKDVVKFKVTKG